MFTKIAPQKVQHSTGYIVQVANRYLIQYIDNERKADVEVDFAKVTGIYPETLVISDTRGEKRAISYQEREEILQRLLLGIEALGISFEVLTIPPPLSGV
jgi:hypothetical protein